jgi:magnesium-transporting ATPase (P-type)
LDGETNLKHKQSTKECISLSKNDQTVLKNFTQASIECDKENESIYTFQGNIRFQDRDTIPLDFEQFLLRGCSLRNTEWVYGIAVYTGHDTKLMINSAKSRPKFSKIELTTNRFMLFSIFLQIVVCIFASIWTVTWQNIGQFAIDKSNSNAARYSYLGLNSSIDLEYSIVS